MERHSWQTYTAILRRKLSAKLTRLGMRNHTKNGWNDREV